MSAVLRSAARIRDLNNAFRRTLCGGRRPLKRKSIKAGHGASAFASQSRLSAFPKASQKRRARLQVPSQTLDCCYFSEGCWWAHQGSNLGPAD